VLWRPPSACATGSSTYFDINLDLHWMTVAKDLPMLLAALSPPEEI